MSQPTVPDPFAELDDLRERLKQAHALIRNMHREALQAESIAAELANVRPVVDAARAWANSPSETSDTADALLDAVKALDDQFGVTCVDCGKAVTDAQPSLEGEHGPVHVGCGDPDA